MSRSKNKGNFLVVPGRTDSTINQSNHEQKRPFCQDYFGKIFFQGISIPKRKNRSVRLLPFLKFSVISQKSPAEYVFSRCISCWNHIQLKQFSYLQKGVNQCEHPFGHFSYFFLEFFTKRYLYFYKTSKAPLHFIVSHKHPSGDWQKVTCCFLLSALFTVPFYHL